RACMGRTALCARGRGCSRTATSSSCSKACACRIRFCSRRTCGRYSSANPLTCPGAHRAADPLLPRATLAARFGAGGLVARPTIALLTDFGNADHYAGTLKGVLLSLCPDATLVDITHEIPPPD